MIADPSETAVTTPVPETVATAGFDDCHVEVLVTSCMVLLESRSVAVSWMV
jgi:hypothetical protein